MAKVSVQAEVSKEAYEAGKALGTLVVKTKEALADGFQIGTDLPAVLTASLADFMTGVDGIDKIGSEAEEDMAAFMRAWMLAGADIAAVFLKKKEADEAPKA